MSDQVLKFGRLEPRLYIDIIGPLVPGVAKVGFTLVLEVIESEFEHVVINAAGRAYLFRQFTVHVTICISIRHRTPDQDDFIVGQEVGVAQRQKVIPAVAIEADHGNAVVRCRVCEFPAKQAVYEKWPVTDGGDQQVFEGGGPVGS